jgi:hypothetical protein
MIQPARFPRPLLAGDLRALHVALNSPVVAHESLPNGPASAAVALDAHGAIVCLRSVRTGQTAFFGSGAELAPQLALDAALSFAESLGFLFDDDEVVLRGEEAALELWSELCGDVAAATARPGADDLDDDADDPLWQRERVRASAPEAPSLSKFRFFAGRA